VVVAASIALPHGLLFGRAVRRFSAGPRDLFLTIDDGPSADTAAILEILARHRAPAVFFLIGENAARRPDDVRAIHAAGHRIGNHTQSHPAAWFWAYSPERLRREITLAQESIVRTGADRPVWFRAPVGLLSPFLPAVATGLSMGVLGWSARGYDAVSTDVEKIVARIRRGLKPGAILLAHQGRPQSIEVLDRLLATCARDGWRFVLPPAPSER